jgi:signal transduction histidine kinase
VEADDGIDARIRGPGPRRVGDELCVFVFQAVRELLANLAKHSKATQGRVAITADDDRLRVTVEDDGVGFDPKAALGAHDQNGKAKNAFGLFSVRERLRHHGGGLEVESAPGGGARFTLDLPLRGSRSEATGPVREG